MKWVNNAAKWYRMFSVQALILLGSISTTLFLIPEGWRQTEFWGWSVEKTLFLISGITAVLGIIGRLVDQFSPKAVENA